MILRDNMRAVSVGLLVFVVMLGAYTTTMAPSVSFIDSGELAAVASILGIAHPTGYPLFTLIGHLATMLPWGTEEVARLNLLSSVLTAAAVSAVYFLILALAPRRRISGKRAETDPSRTWMDLVPAVAGALIVGTSVTVWAQSVAIEVYSLHLLLVTLVLTFAVTGVQEQRRNRAVTSRRLVLAFFLLGLAFANHMTTVLLVPGLLYLYWAGLSMDRASGRRILRLSPFFFLGLSPYTYLVVRASSNPPLDWGHPSSLGGLLWHVSGKQYRSWIFSGFESAVRQFKYFTGRLPEEFSWIALALAAIGLWAVWKSERRLFWLLVILFVSCVFYAINYDIHDIDSYFLLAYLVIGLAAALGIRELDLRLAGLIPRWGRLALAAGFLALGVVQFFEHREAVDQSDNHMVQDYTRTILASVDSNAVVISYQWDYFVSPSLYFQFVRRERTDVVVVDKELLRRSWYFHMLERNWPWLVARCRSSIDRFLVELRKFEGGLPYRYEEIESSYRAMINDLIHSSMKDRSVYLGPEIEPQFGTGLERVPDGLLFRLEEPGRKLTLPEEKPLPIRLTRYKDKLADGLRYQCARMLVFRALWLARLERRKEALGALDSASIFAPRMPEIARLRKEIESTR